MDEGSILQRPTTTRRKAKTCTYSCSFFINLSRSRSTSLGESSLCVRCPYRNNDNGPRILDSIYIDDLLRCTFLRVVVYIRTSETCGGAAALASSLDTAP